eukprot:Gb_08682 [translate_table: standard]
MFSSQMQTLFSSFKGGKTESCMLQLFWICLTICLCYPITSNGRCIKEERQALQKFKAGLEGPEGRLSSWKSSECCEWAGIECDNETGDVIKLDLHNPYPYDPYKDNTAWIDKFGLWNLSGKINPGLFDLQHLKHLDLSFNTFEGIQIAPGLGSLASLTYLNLSEAGFRGEIPWQLENLSSLNYLDVSSSLGSLSSLNLWWAANLSALRHLPLDGVDLSAASDSWGNAISKITNLVELHLSGCGLSGDIPDPLLNITSLALLHLDMNSFFSEMPHWLVNMSSLISLHLSSSSLYGSIPLGLSELLYLKELELDLNKNLTADVSKLLKGRWSRLSRLGLADNKVSGTIPPTTGNITSLVYLNLFSNQIEGGIPSTMGNLCNFQFLDLSGNNMSGELPDSIGENSCNCRPEGNTDCTMKPFSSLRYLYLCINQLQGTIPPWLGQLSNLIELDLSYNSLQGSTPSSLSQLSSLTSLRLGSNQLSGTVAASLGWLSKLIYLDLSFNHLTGVISESHFDNLTNLVYLDFSWNLLTFNLSHLNLSYNSIEGQLPAVLNVVSYADIDLSHNLLEGRVPLPSSDVELFDLSKNRLTGPIPPAIGTYMPSAIFLSLSSNHLTGNIPSSIGDMLYMQVLDLSSNELISNLPSHLGNCSYLKVLDLANNHLYGTIPQTWGQLQQLQTLHLHNNSLNGSLPSSLQKCTALETVDLGENYFSGSIPRWIAHLSDLRILMLRSNMFQGQIPSEISELNSLHVLDLAQNNLSGIIPNSIANFTAVIDKPDSNKALRYGQYRGLYYQENLQVINKGQNWQYTTILSLITCIDLSNNNLVGEIPVVIGTLRGLIVFNVSRNHLSGKIPQGRPLDTFNASIYLGNSDLCGSPLIKECPPEDSSPPEALNGGEDEDRGFEIPWCGRLYGTYYSETHAMQLQNVMLHHQVEGITLSNLPDHSHLTDNYTSNYQGGIGEV